ncbi:hypothetical protein [Ilumatobacter sp.]|uniref:hypothetical protein n=1 Tax=Ilumatobacter sp. TaxID=1967498 RepID=UPI003C55C7F4
MNASQSGVHNRAKSSHSSTILAANADVLFGVLQAEQELVEEGNGERRLSAQSQDEFNNPFRDSEIPGAVC